VLASGYGETEISKAFRTHFVQARREFGRALLQRAVDLGKIRPEIDLDATVDQLYGAIFYRLLMGHAPVTRPFIATLFDQVMLGVQSVGTRADAWNDHPQRLGPDAECQGGTRATVRRPSPRLGANAGCRPEPTHAVETDHVVVAAEPEQGAAGRGQET
jgi:hypothetical protein